MKELRSARRRLDRRRFIAIAAAAAGTALTSRNVASSPSPEVRWRGVVLGAEASLVLQHADEDRSRDAVEATLAEVARLEAIFSLHRTDSALVRLNSFGQLDGAPLDLCNLLAEAHRISEQSGGAFDVTVQPLWSLYARHFARPNADPNGPDEAELAAARELVDWRGIAVDGSRITLRRSGMAVTLNGIAQGYITDRVGDLLRQRGFEHVLINLGETLAIGPKGSGGAWRVGVADPRRPDAVLETIPLMSGAVATSGGYGCRFDAGGSFTHILDPRTGASARNWESITVVAERATAADGWSTALAASPPAAVETLIGPTARVYGVPFVGSVGAWL